PAWATAARPKSRCWLVLPKASASPPIRSRRSPTWPGNAAMAEPRFGLSGRLARAFQANPLTPVLAVAGLLLGLFATLITPREEEPQIDVTMANVIVPFPGAPAEDVENLLTYPLE